MHWYENPFKVFTVGLILFCLGAIAYNWRLPVWALVASVTVGSLMGYFILKKLQPRGHLMTNTIVTFLIALMLINPALDLTLEALLWGVLGGLLVILAKLGPNFKKTLIFNPAALGLLVWSFLLFLVYGGEAMLPLFVSWWGADYASPYPLLLLIPLILYAGFKFRKQYLLLTFLIVNALWIAFNSGVAELVYPYTSGMIYFMAGVMLIEPKSSPTNKFWQIGAGIVAVGTYRLIGNLGFTNVELWAIIAVNLVNLLSRTSFLKYFRSTNFKNAKV